MARECCWCDRDAVGHLEYAGRRHDACREHLALYGDGDDGPPWGLLVAVSLGFFVGGFLSWFGC